jgi:hypothetical protein
LNLTARFSHVASLRIARAQRVTATYAEYYLNPFKAAAVSFAVEAIAAPVRDPFEVESVVAAQARAPNSGLIVMPDAFMSAHRAEVTSLAAHHRLPVISPYRFYTELGGLLSYGNDILDNFRRAATYADRVLKGAKPSELPVQAPVKFELVVNLKTAKALGFDVPPLLQQRAITLLGGAAAWPLAARAQQSTRVSRIGYLIKPHVVHGDVCSFPAPIAGAGLPGLLFASGGLLALARRHGGLLEQSKRSFFTAVAAALLASGKGNTVTTSGPRARLRSGRNSAQKCRPSPLQRVRRVSVDRATVSPAREKCRPHPQRGQAPVSRVLLERAPRTQIPGHGNLF